MIIGQIFTNLSLLQTLKFIKKSKHRNSHEMKLDSYDFTKS